MKVQGYFSGISEANAAVERLEIAGFQNAFVDINDHYIDDKNVQTNLAGTSAAPNLSELVLHSGENKANMGNSPLDAASPMVSGYGKYEDVAKGAKYIVNVDVDGSNSSEAEEIIKAMGGDLENPH